MRVHIPNTDYDVLIRFECDVYKVLASGGSREVSLVSVETLSLCRTTATSHMHQYRRRLWVGLRSNICLHTHTRVLFLRLQISLWCVK